MSKWLKCVSVWFSSLLSRIVIQLSFNSISFSKGLRFRPNSIQAGKYGQSRLFIHSFPRPVRLCLFASIWQFPIEWSNSVRQLIRYKCFVVRIVSQFIEFIQFEALRCKIYNRSFVKIFQKIAKSVCFRGVEIDEPIVGNIFLCPSSNESTEIESQSKNFLSMTLT